MRCDEEIYEYISSYVRQRLKENGINYTEHLWSGFHQMHRITKEAIAELELQLGVDITKCSCDGSGLTGKLESLRVRSIEESKDSLNLLQELVGLKQKISSAVEHV